MITYLHKYPEVNIVIEGHTDDVGGEADNQLLSENRAKAVYTYLLDALIKKERLEYIGYGESKTACCKYNTRGQSTEQKNFFSCQIAFLIFTSFSNKLSN